MDLKRFKAYLILVLPLFSLYLLRNYHDQFYTLLLIVSLALSVLVLFPKTLPNKQILLKIPRFQRKVRNRKREIHSREDGVLNVKIIAFRSTLPLLLAASLIVFTIISVFFLPLPSSAINIFTAYLLAYLRLLEASPLTIIIPVLALVFVFYYSQKAILDKFEYFRPLHPGNKSYLFIGGAILTSFVLSFFTAYLFGIVDANYSSVQIKLNPQANGVIWGKDKIVQQLKGMNNPPKIIEGGGDVNKNIIFLNSSNNSKGQYYSKYIAKNIPPNLVISPGVPNDPIVMIGNNLIINSIDQTEMQAISPTLARLMAGSYFKGRYIKSDPQVQILGRQEYLKFRDDQINAQIAQIDKLISAADDIINGLYSSISNDKAKLSANQSGLSYSTSERDSEYQYCTTAGYYFYGFFYHTFSQSYCDGIQSQWDSTIAQYQQNINSWQSQLSYDEGQLPQYQQAKETLTTYENFVSSQKDSTPQELGLFTPDNNIKIALDYTGSKSVTEYLETLVHEYMHYTSYVAQDRTLPQFFEEGFTEYYARHIIKQNLGVDTNFGYPLLEKIIYQMATKIPDSTIQDIYFNKDQNELQSVLDSTFGKDFYKNSEYYFSVILYVPPNDALKFANNIMAKIGGKPLKESDMVSDMSQVN